MTSGTPAARLVVDGVRLGASRALDLSVAAGEVVAVTGETSSDLLWVAAGQLRPDAGRVAVDGRPVEDPSRAYALGIALIPQGNGLAQLLTARENVLLPLSGHDGHDHDLDDPGAAARDALAAVGLADSADHLIEELSGGQQQRVAVARALALRPRLLLADQATTDLDPGNRARVLTLFRELVDGGAAVLLASDDPAVVAACDRVVRLDPTD